MRVEEGVSKYLRVETEWGAPRSAVEWLPETREQNELPLDCMNKEVLIKEELGSARRTLCHFWQPSVSGSSYLGSEESCVLTFHNTWWNRRETSDSYNYLVKN